VNEELEASRTAIKYKAPVHEEDANQTALMNNRAA
jgi:hypothetical protein